MNTLLFYSDDIQDHVAFPTIHIRIQKRNGRKCITTIEGLSKETAYDVGKHIRKILSTNGTVIDTYEGFIVQVQGDKRMELQKYLVDNQITLKEYITIHGF